MLEKSGKRYYFFLDAFYFSYFGSHRRGVLRGQATPDGDGSGLRLAQRAPRSRPATARHRRSSKRDPLETNQVREPCRATHVTNHTWRATRQRQTATAARLRLVQRAPCSRPATARHRRSSKRDPLETNQVRATAETCRTSPTWRTAMRAAWRRGCWRCVGNAVSGRATGLTQPGIGAVGRGTGSSCSPRGGSALLAMSAGEIKR